VAINVIQRRAVKTTVSNFFMFCFLLTSGFCNKGSGAFFYIFISVPAPTTALKLIAKKKKPDTQKGNPAVLN
jgi:hypothetical protein